ncbi:Dabb family protein [Lachnospiraceae bacterium OttesenSCG-928-D06]|nr:Dabb family protein [Lachnospiraceae bacterium OttesenSCG-928-D06]
MTKHIVMWNFKPEIKEEEKEEIRTNMKNNLCSLVGQVPGLINAQFVEVPLSSSTHDMALVTDFDSAESLGGYKNHPAHVHVANTYVRPFVWERACLDYDIDDRTI